MRSVRDNIRNTAECILKEWNWYIKQANGDVWKCIAEKAGCRFALEAMKRNNLIKDYSLDGITMHSRYPKEIED